MQWYNSLVSPAEVRMTLALTLPAELEARLRCEAERCGQPADALAVQLLDRHLPADHRTAALELLRRWAIEDDALSEAELAENAALLRDLDANRSSDRKLFPELAEKPS